MAKSEQPALRSQKTLLRSGGPTLRKSAVYPPRYGRRVAELHQLFKESCYGFSKVVIHACMMFIARRRMA